MELYIIRHGQSTNNAVMEDRKLRVADPPLTEAGHRQAHLLAQYFKDSVNIEDIVLMPTEDERRLNGSRHRITHLYCSAMHRAMQTAKPLGETLGLRPEVWIDIHEHGGIWIDEDGAQVAKPGLTRAQMLAEFPDYQLPDSVTDEGWWSHDGEESLELTYVRAERVAEALLDRAHSIDGKHDRVALVTHGTFIDCLIKALLNRGRDDTHYHWHYNTGVTRLDFRERGLRLMRYINRVSHLPLEIVT